VREHLVSLKRIVVSKMRMGGRREDVYDEGVRWSIGGMPRRIETNM
jgi:hypothetical protein